MKLKEAKKILEAELQIQYCMSDLVVNKDKNHREILQVKLGEPVTQVAARMIEAWNKGA